MEGSCPAVLFWSPSIRHIGIANALTPARSPFPLAPCPSASSTASCATLCVRCQKYFTSRLCTATALIWETYTGGTSDLTLMQRESRCCQRSPCVYSRRVSGTGNSRSLLRDSVHPDSFTKSCPCCQNSACSTFIKLLANTSLQPMITAAIESLKRLVLQVHSHQKFELFSRPRYANTTERSALIEFHYLWHAEEHYFWGS